MAEISDKDLGWLIWCAMSYDRRIPSGVIPHRLWEQLSTEQRARLNRWTSAKVDGLGAEIRPGVTMAATIDADLDSAVEAASTR